MSLSALLPQAAGTTASSHFLVSQWTPRLHTQLLQGPGRPPRRIWTAAGRGSRLLDQMCLSERRRCRVLAEGHSGDLRVAGPPTQTDAADQMFPYTVAVAVKHDAKCCSLIISNVLVGQNEKSQSFTSFACYAFPKRAPEEKVEKISLFFLFVCSFIFIHASLCCKTKI